jgi:hypothetical protein
LAVRIGFTGTRQGMTREQERTLRELLSRYKGAVLHHGDAVGSDAEAHNIGVAFGCTVVIHPPTNGARRAWKIGAEVRAPRR